MELSKLGTRCTRRLSLGVSPFVLIMGGLAVSLSVFSQEALSQSTTLAESSEMKVVDGLMATEKGRSAALAAYANLDEAANCVGLTMSVISAELSGGVTLTPDDHLYYAILLKSGTAYRDGKGENNEAFSKRIPSADFVSNNATSLKARCDENFKQFAHAAGF